MKASFISPKSTLIFILSFLLSGCISELSGQGRIGINTAAPLAGLHVKDSSALFTGKYPSPGIVSAIPVTGPGTRMMWYPDKAAFRVGQVTGTEWDTIGIASFAAGYNTRARQQYSTAIGANASAKGVNSVAIGRDVKAHTTSSLAIGGESNALGMSAASIGLMNNSLGDFTLTVGNSNNAYGEASIALGSGNTVNGSSAMAVGTFNTANGFYSTAIGVNSFATGDFANTFGFSIKSNSFLQTTLGQYNDTTFAVDPFSWVPTDPLFVIGNGDEVNLHNALTVLKNGNTGIGIHNPAALLDVNGTSKLGANGTPISEIIKVSVVKDIGNIGSQSTSAETFTVTNAEPGSTVHVSPALPLNAGLMIAYARVSSTGNVEVTFANVTGSPINQGNATYYISVIR